MRYRQWQRTNSIHFSFAVDSDIHRVNEQSDEKNISLKCANPAKDIKNRFYAGFCVRFRESLFGMRDQRLSLVIYSFLYEPRGCW
jgi:hypothetical protein